MTFAALKDAFNELDYSGNGSIRAHDLGTALRAIGQTPTEADIHELVLDAVLDGQFHPTMLSILRLIYIKSLVPRTNGAGIDIWVYFTTLAFRDDRVTRFSQILFLI